MSDRRVTLPVYLSASKLKTNLRRDDSVYNKRTKIRWFKKPDPTTGKKTKQRAMCFCDTLSTGMPVVSHQYAQGKGARRYAVTSWPSFFKNYYSTLSPNERTFNEIIRGKDTPCKVYFDVDAVLSKENPEEGRRRIEKKISFLVKITYELLKNSYGCERATSGRSTVMLDSSKGEKFSRHIVLNLKGNAMFIDQENLRMFVYSIYFLGTTTYKKELFFEERGKPKFIFDLSVYKGDREFRLYGSTKNEKTKRWLRYLDSNRTTRTLEGSSITLVDEKIFYDSLVCYLPKDEEIEHLLECTVDEKGRRRIPAAISNLLDLDRRVRLKRSFRSASRPSNGGRVSTRGVDGGMYDLFNRVARDIEMQRDQDETLALLDFFPETGYCITFSSTGKYCEIKRDLHTSNHVYFVCWLGSGVFYQKCFNTECKMAGYRRYEEKKERVRKENKEKERGRTRANTVKTKDIDGVDDEKNKEGKKGKGEGKKEEERTIYTARGATRRLSEDLWLDLKTFIENDKKLKNDDVGERGEFKGGTEEDFVARFVRKRARRTYSADDEGPEGRTDAPRNGMTDEDLKSLFG